MWVGRAATVGVPVRRGGAFGGGTWPGPLVELSRPWVLEELRTFARTHRKGVGAASSTPDRPCALSPLLGGSLGGSTRSVITTQLPQAIGLGAARVARRVYFRTLACGPPRLRSEFRGKSIGVPVTRPGLTILLSVCVGPGWVLAAAPEPLHFSVREPGAAPSPGLAGSRHHCAREQHRCHSCTGLLWCCMLATRHWPGPHRLSGGPAHWGGHFYSGGAPTGTLLWLLSAMAGLLGVCLPWLLSCHGWAEPSASSYRGGLPLLSTSSRP